MKRFKFFKGILASLGMVFMVFSVLTICPFPGLVHVLFQVAPDVALAAFPPVITINSPVNGQFIGSIGVNVTGTTEPGGTVDVFIDGTMQGTTVADGSGNWYFAANSLSETTHSVYAVVTDSNNGTSTSETVSFTIDITPPVITVTSPLNGQFTNMQSITGQTEPGLPVTVCVYGRETTVNADILGSWTYSDPLLPEGTLSVNAVATDWAGNVGTSGIYTFVLDKTRSLILPEIYPHDDMTQVTLDTVTRVYLIEESPIAPLTLSRAILLRQKGSLTGEVYGAVYSSVYADVYGEPYYEIVFQPEQPLKPATKYSVSVNPLLADIAGNFVYARSWSFTTVSGSVYDNPHGWYLANTNVCGNCHTPHQAGSPRLVEPRDAQFVKIDDYCKACHDGTVAPLPENWLAANRHDHKMTIEGTVGASSCTSCHNPHLSWTPDNPNFIQDYYYYEHNDPTNPYLPNSSEQSMCNLCHDPSIIDDARVRYVNYQYNKWHSTSGTAEDYSLCFRCHDGGSATNIKGLYSSPSGHSIKATDGSYLNGPLACADCHNSHGSSNLKQLKTEIGHSSPRTFETGSAAWDPATERRFCKSCHNNITGVYGVVGGFVYSIPGHEEFSTEFCHSCHGGSPMQAAHAPTMPTSN